MKWYFWLLIFLAVFWLGILIRLFLPSFTVVYTYSVNGDIKHAQWGYQLKELE